MRFLIAPARNSRSNTALVLAEASDNDGIATHMNKISPGLLQPCLFLILTGLLSPADAQAYLDPGSGSMLLQVILGGIAALGVAIKLYWYKLKALFGFSKQTDTEESAD
jgi:hypothetical protein